MKTVKKITSILLCAVVSCSIYLYCGMVFSPKDIHDSGGALYYNGTGFLSEPKDSLDLIIYGNSDVYSGFSPAVLKDTYGYTSYASGRARQNLANINALLDQTLAVQRPKLIILETDCFFEKNLHKSQESNPIFQPFVFHSRWKELEWRDFYQRPSREKYVDASKGYVYSDVVGKTEFQHDYMGNPQAKPEKIAAKNLEWIDTFISACKQHRIPVLLLELPSPYSWNYGRHNAVARLAHSYALPFLDLNLDPDAYGLNLNTDFRDNGDHLNYSGARKTTTYIGAYIGENYPRLFPKHKANTISIHNDTKQNETNPHRAASEEIPSVAARSYMI